MTLGEAEVTSTPDIHGVFRNFSSSLYPSKVTVAWKAMETFLDTVTLQYLYDQARDVLEAPITLEKLQVVVKAFPNNKAPRVMVSSQMSKRNNILP